MIWILKNISVHLWITTLFSIPFSFYILPGLVKFFPGINPVVTGLLIITSVVAALGFFMHMTAKKIVTRLIKEGQIWERSGILNKAEKNYIKALRIYDTFLLRPFFVKKTAKKISGAIAKFTLNTSMENQNFKLATAVYLKMNPQDADIAELWLKKVHPSTVLTSFEQDILSILAETHFANQRLSPLLANIFIDLDRKDFTARKLYQSVQKGKPAGESVSNKTDDTTILADAVVNVTTIDDSAARPGKTYQEEVAFSHPLKKDEKKTEMGKRLHTIALRGVASVRNAGSCMGSVFSFLTLSLSRAMTYLKEHERVQFYLKAGFLSIIFAWLLFLMVSTVSHMSTPAKVETQKVIIEIQEPKPFAIQVAAYLKQEHAVNYVDRLKKKGIDATYKKVDGGGKTWFVVRVSEFVDKKDAAAYGHKLKQEKMIDDFFVTNR